MLEAEKKGSTVEMKLAKITNEVASFITLAKITNEVASFKTLAKITNEVASFIFLAKITNEVAATKVNISECHSNEVAAT